MNPSTQTTLSNDAAVERLRDRFHEICEGWDPATAAVWWTEITGFQATTDGHFMTVTCSPEHVGAFLQLYIEGTLESDNSSCLAEMWQTLFGQEATPVSGVMVTQSQEEANG